MMTEGKKFLNKFPDMIPIIIQFPKCSNLNMTKTQKRIKAYTTCTEFVLLCKRSIINHNPSCHTTYFFHVKNYSILGGQTSMREIYDKYKDEDDILRVFCSEENMFG